MSEKKNSDIIKQEDHAKVEKYSTFEEFNENTLRVRRNLLIFSVIALFYKLSGATLTGKSSFLGLEFEHINPEMIDLFLLCIVGYHLVHFMWLAFENFVHYYVRFWTAIKSKSKELLEEKYINDKIVKPTMIGSWRILNASIKKNLEKTRKKTKEIKSKIKNSDKSKIKNSEIIEFEEELEIVSEMIKNNQLEIEEMLESFKKEAEEQFIKINKWRYFLIETSFPSLIGIFAVFVLVL
jgi:hypothetical protein